VKRHSINIFFALFLLCSNVAFALDRATESVPTPAFGRAFGSEFKVFANDYASNDQFGSAVAVFGDTAVVGAIADSFGTTPNAGSAYVFVRSGASWIQQAKLTASDAATSASFGWTVAISGDTVLVGAPNSMTSGGFSAGAAYVFTRVGTVWTQQAKLVADDTASNDKFGSAVALNSDTAIVGSHLDDNAGGVDAGAAYVFLRNGSTWSQQSKLLASDAAADDRFGFSVAIASDSALVGAQTANTSAGNDAGSAYVFTRNTGVWTQQAKLTASDGAASDNFGHDVALSGDTALIGAPLDGTPTMLAIGSAYVFTRVSGVWTQQAKLIANDGTSLDFFGTGLDISGNVAVMGAASADSNTRETGAAYVFARTGGTWSQQSKLVGRDVRTFDAFGRAAAVAGNTMLIGARTDYPVPTSEIFVDGMEFADNMGSGFFYTQ
jgi:hypothetical protein